MMAISPVQMIPNDAPLFGTFIANLRPQRQGVPIRIVLACVKK